MFNNVKAGFILWSYIALGYVAADSNCDSILSEKSDTTTLTALLNSAGSVLEDVKRRINLKQSLNGISASCDEPMDCAEIYEKCKITKSGIYNVWPRNRLFKCSIQVYCDMDDDGGGWTVIQRRGDFDSGKDYFYRDWAAYKNGFGNLMKDFWIGNDIIFALTNQRGNLVKFVLTDWEENTTYATYEEFWIDDEIHNYTMHVKSYRGTAGDSFGFTNDTPFTTKDADNDIVENGNCAVSYKGAWWYKKCHSSNLNGYYLKGVHESYADGVEWSSFRGAKYSLKDTFIKIRPTGFKKQIEADVTPH